MPSSKDYMEMDDKYCAHNYHPIPVVISKAEGVWVYDPEGKKSVSYTHLRAHETEVNLVCRLLLEKIFFNDTATTEIYT